MFLQIWVEGQGIEAYSVPSPPYSGQLKSVSLTTRSSPGSMFCVHSVYDPSTDPAQGPTSTSSSRCPPFLVFSSIWPGCAHPLRKGCCSREMVPWGHLGLGGRTAAIQPEPASRACPKRCPGPHSGSITRPGAEGPALGTSGAPRGTQEAKEARGQVRSGRWVTTTQK